MSGTVHRRTSDPGLVDAAAHLASDETSRDEAAEQMRRLAGRLLGR